MATIFIPLALACIMLTVGLGLATTDFRALLRRPRTVLMGLVAQLVLLPLAALGAALIFALTPLAAIGLVLIACVPGGVTSNFITVLARGDAALSVVLTATATAVGVVTVPLVLYVTMTLFDPGGLVLPDALGTERIAATVLFIVAVPMMLGMVLRGLWPLIVERCLIPARRFATGLFILIVLSAFSADWQVIEDHWRSIGPVVLAFNAVAIVMGLTLGRLARLGGRSTITLGIECGLQNVALALFLGGTVLGDPALMVPAIIYALVMNASALVLIALGRSVATGKHDMGSKTLGSG